LISDFSRQERHGKMDAIDEPLFSLGVLSLWRSDVTHVLKEGIKENRNVVAD